MHPFPLSSFCNGYSSGIFPYRYLTTPARHLSCYRPPGRSEKALLFLTR